ncbi:UNVERIFIED_CONTAM: Btg4 [Trichonephila clavipes]
MKEEIWAAVNFLTRLVGKYDSVTEAQVKSFQETLIEILTEKFKGHWFPEKPNRGQAYRCIRVNGNERKDPVLEKAAEKCGLQYENLNLPAELTVWVDPQEVCCRFGENEGSYCTVACFKDNKENLSNNVQSLQQVNY